MATVLYTGIPGSGKTYRVVYDLMHDEELRRDYYLLHNIDGLNHDMWNNGRFIKRFDEIPGFEFSTACVGPLATMAQEKYNRNLFIVVDEAAEFFGRWSGVVEQFFDWHRHHGLLIWLMCPSFDKIDRKYSANLNYEIRADNPYFSALTGRFSYKWKSQNENFKRDFRKKSKAVYGAYKSWVVAAGKQGKTRMHYTIIVVFVVAAVALYLFYRGFHGYWSKGNEKLDAIVGINKRQAGGAPPAKPSAAAPVVVASPKTVRSRGHAGLHEYEGLQADYSVCGLVGERVIMRDSLGRLVSLDMAFPDGKLVKWYGGSQGCIIDVKGRLVRLYPNRGVYIDWLDKVSVVRDAGRENLEEKGK